MRDIKFKVWDKSREKFVCCYQSALNFTLDTGQVYNNGFNCTSNLELMQFTGLTDKNGVEIYEGDIVSGRDSDAEIKFFHGCWMAFYGEHQYFNVHFHLVELEVIGNIHENPELLNK